MKLVTLIFVLSALLSSRAARAQVSQCLAVSAVVQEGDLVFISIPNPIFRRVAAATGTWASHVGVVFKDEREAWVVAESKIPRARETPLCEFLRRSENGEFEIRRRNQALSKLEVETLHASTRTMMGRFYTLSFNFDSQRLFCSKLAHLAYKSIHIDVGRVQTFRDLLAENPKASLTFWKVWFFGFIPWDRRTITPASELRDPQFFTVLKY